MSGAIETQGSRLGILSVTEAVSVTFDGSDSTIIRASGSFVDDGFTTDMLLLTSDTDNPGPFTVTAVSATEITVSETVTTDAVAAEFTIEGFTRIRGITTYTGFDGTAAEIDTTDLDSEAKEFIMGLQDFGSFSVDGNMLPGDVGQNLLRAAKSSRVVQDFMFVRSNRSRARFNAYVLSASESGGVDAKADGAFGLRITGLVTFTQAPA